MRLALFRRLCLIAALVALCVVVLGAWVRLSHAGLGCPDWPGCYGHSNPLSADEPIRAAETALPSGPATATSCSAPITSGPTISTAVCAARR